MSPLEAIVRWLEGQDLDTQLEVAAFATFPVFVESAVLTLAGPARNSSTQRWLTEPKLDSQAVL